MRTVPYVILKNWQLNDIALREYHAFVRTQYCDLFSEAGSVAQKIDSLLNFYCDLYG